MPQRPGWSRRTTTMPRAGGLVPPSLVRWTVLCAAAECVGMTAAAAAAKTSHLLVGEPSTGSEVAAAVSLAVAGGLVEGLALGVAQSSGLSSWLPGRRRAGWVLATLAVAGLGWAGASVPVALAGGGGAQPPLLLVLVGAVGVGLVMGPVLGAAQALVLRGPVPHPWRWVPANAFAWALAMPVVFLGATSPGDDWSVPAVMASGAVTGAAAGGVLGVVSGWFLVSLVGPSAHNRVVLGALGSPTHRLLDRSLVGLRLRGVVSGAEITLPVMFAGDDEGLVVVPGHPGRKRWWRNLRRRSPVSVLLHGRWHAGTGEVLRSGDIGYDAAMSTYRQRWPRAGDLDGVPVVRVRLQR